MDASVHSQIELYFLQELYCPGSFSCEIQLGSDPDLFVQWVSKVCKHKVNAAGFSRHVIVEILVRAHFFFPCIYHGCFEVDHEAMSLNLSDR